MTEDVAAAPRRIVLVSCGMRKRREPAEAQRLYTSELFEKSAAYARASFDRWFILSAAHGLVLPDTMLEPYDRSIAELTVPEQEAWARQVAGDLRRLQPGTVATRGPRLGAAGAETTITLLAGRAYAEPLMPLIVVAQPLRGMRTDDRIAWLKQQLARATSE
jgi:hypothetical protein